MENDEVDVVDWPCHSARKRSASMDSNSTSSSVATLVENTGIEPVTSCLQSLSETATRADFRAAR